MEQLIKEINAENAYDQAAQGIGSGRKDLYLLYKQEVYGEDYNKQACDVDNYLFCSVAVYRRPHHEHIEQEFNGSKKVI